MSPRALVAISLPAVLAILVLVFLQRRDGEGRRFAESESATRWSLGRLLLASFLTLFAELALIRWIAVEVRIFAYFKNLALLLCFLGFGFGCALSRARQRWVLAAISLLGLLLIIRGPLNYNGALDRLSQYLGSSSDVHIWQTQPTSWAGFLLAAMVCGFLMVLITAVFVPLG
jgi:hypothetical protein